MNLWKKILGSWKRSPFYIPGLIVVAGIGIFLLIMLFSPRASRITVKDEAIPVQAKKVTLAPHVPQLLLYGKVQTPREAKLEAAITAFVKSTPRLAGSIVKKGDVIIVLDDSDIRILYNQRKAEVDELKAVIAAEIKKYEADKKSLEHEKRLHELAKKEVERLAKLAKGKYVSVSDYDKAMQAARRQALLITNREMVIENFKNMKAQLKAKLAKAEAIFDQAKLDLSRSNIRAPFSGQISMLNVSVGDRVVPGEMMAQIIDTSELEVLVQIPQRYALKAKQAVAEKRKVSATMFYDRKKIALHLDRLAGVVGEGRGAVDGVFVLNKSMVLPVGLSLPIMVNLTPINNAVALPEKALYGKNRIYLIKKNQLHAVTVTHVGNHYHSQTRYDVLVQSPSLKNGDMVLITHLPNAISGLKVKLIP